MRKAYQNNRGFALALSLIFLFLVVAFVAAYILSTTNGLTVVNRTADSKRAYYMADAGLSEGYIQLRSYASAPNSFTLTNNSYSLGNGKNGSYSVTATKEASAWSTYTIVSTGTYNGTSKSMQLRVQQSSISTFAYMSNTEIHPVWGALWWITGMTTVGPVRSNGTLNIWGSPIFNGTTTQSGAAINYWVGAPNNPQFVNGLTLSAPTVPFPTSTMLNGLSSSAQSSGLKLTGNTTVIFNANGTVNVTNSAKGWSNQNMALPANGIIYVQSGSATVKGTIHGQATVVSDSQVYISGNLVYSSDPRTNPSSTDLLGLVSKNDITVLESSAPSNLELDAVLVALQGSFQVDHWWVSGKGNMIQYGSLVNNYCGPTGVFDPGTGTLYGGYNQLQYYDPRLVTMVPPGFPPVSDNTGRYVYTKLSFREL